MGRGAGHLLELGGRGAAAGQLQEPLEAPVQAHDLQPGALHSRLRLRRTHGSVEPFDQGRGAEDVAERRLRRETAHSRRSAPAPSGDPLRGLGQRLRRAAQRKLLADERVRLGGDPLPGVLVLEQRLGETGEGFGTGREEVRPGDERLVVVRPLAYHRGAAVDRLEHPHPFEVPLRVPVDVEQDPRARQQVELVGPGDEALRAGHVGLGVVAQDQPAAPGGEQRGASAEDPLAAQGGAAEEGDVDVPSFGRREAIPKRRVPQGHVLGPDPPRAKQLSPSGADVERRAAPRGDPSRVVEPAHPGLLGAHADGPRQRRAGQPALLGDDQVLVRRDQRVGPAALRRGPPHAHRRRHPQALELGSQRGGELGEEGVLPGREHEGQLSHGPDRRAQGSPRRTPD